MATGSGMAITVRADVAAFMRGCGWFAEILNGFCHEVGMLRFLFAPGIASDVQAAIRYARS